MFCLHVQHFLDATDAAFEYRYKADCLGLAKAIMSVPNVLQII